MISILTPTYNRAYTLERLFESLVAQNDQNFEWVIVDDGSTDNTKELVLRLEQKKQIPIKYYYKDNTGKPTALNIGAKKCSGDYIFIVDSDDALTNDAISSLKQSIDQAKQENTPISGVGFRRSYFSGEIIGNVFDEHTHSILYLNASEAATMLRGDLAYCFDKKYLLDHPFPSYKDEKFVPELYIWNRITEQAKIRFNIVKSIYLCDYLEDGLSRNFKLQLRMSPKGFKLFYLDQFKREKHLNKKIKMAIRYLQCCLYEKLK
ncbi:glycosyltransferase family A protein [Leclercia sp.]|uniref:glycosyltransferase family A protein n=1 Tax=Leclercia sp. TaxID=1898428 RepID=UPI00289B4E9C|nr:glycosyltransferase family A protein [Leclercia sp.]